MKFGRLVMFIIAVNLIVDLAHVHVSNSGWSALGVIAILVFFSGIGKRKAEVKVEVPSESKSRNRLSDAEQNALKPLTDSYAALNAVVKRNKGVPELKAIGEDALKTADKIIANATPMVRAQQDAAAMLGNREQLEQEAASIELRIQGSASETERESLERALQAHRQAMASASSVEPFVNEIDIKIREAAALITELQSRMTAAAVANAVTPNVTYDLRENLSNLKALSESLAETQEYVNQHQ